MRVVMTAAHGGYNSDQVPLGGAAAICERLREAWPDCLLLGSGPGADLRLGGLNDRIPSQLSELEYAAFSRRFEQEATQAIIAMQGDPVVLSHDISEGPDFNALAHRGVDCLAILHVDVVDYFQRFYLGDLLPPHFWTWLHRMSRLWLPWPDLLQLVFEKQWQAASHCRSLIVPSEPMRGILQREYPFMPERRVEVVPWGAPSLAWDQEALQLCKQELRQSWGPGPYVLTLSRIAPEKGQHILLQEDLPGVAVIVAGAPSYMMGQSYMKRLQELAQGKRVIFPGHLGGVMKRAALELADIFVVCSRYESYGLTILEAMAAGCPIVAVPSSGVTATVKPAWGRVVRPDHLWPAIKQLLSQDDLRLQLGAAAQIQAAKCSFDQAAQKLWKICQGGGRRNL